MHDMGIKPNLSTYTAIIDGLVFQGNLEMALHYIFKMKREEIIPEISAMQGVIILAADCGYSRIAVELATYFEDASLRRLDESVWEACLSSSAQNLYVSIGDMA